MENTISFGSHGAVVMPHYRWTTGRSLNVTHQVCVQKQCKYIYVFNTYPYILERFTRNLSKKGCHALWYITDSYQPNVGLTTSERHVWSDDEHERHQEKTEISANYSFYDGR